MSLEFYIAAFVGVAASTEDLLRRTISNWIPAAALAGGLYLQVAENGIRGAGLAALGSLAGFGIFLIFYLLGGMGGGDVKLMAGFGALLGIERVLPAAFWVSLAGALLALGVIAGAWLRRTKSAPRSIPYAPAIALGVWIVLIQKG
jgi:prepilin peptidase CpaA